MDKTQYFWLSSSCPAFPCFPSHIFPNVPLSNPCHCIFFNENSHRTRRLSISEINISKSYISLMPLRKQILCVMIRRLGRCCFLTEIRRRQSSVSAHPFNSGCFICCSSSSQATIVSLLKWNTLRFFNRHDYIIARSRTNYLLFILLTYVYFCYLMCILLLCVYCCLTCFS